MPHDAKQINDRMAKINGDPTARKALIKDLGALLKKHGIHDADGLFGGPDNKILKGPSESSGVVTIIY